MRKLLTIICLLTITVSSFAKAYKVDELPVKTEYMDSTDFTAVCNPDGILSPQKVTELNNRLWKLKSTMDVQGLVIVVKESDPVDGYDFAMQAGKKFGVGGKNNLGFVIFLSTVSRKYYILTGTGMEKYLTDAEASDIGRHIMVPLLKEGKWEDAISSGLVAIDNICNGEITPAEIAQMDSATAMTEQPDADDGSFWLGVLAAGGVVGGGIAYWRKKDRKARTCLKCQKEGAVSHVFRNVTYLPEGESEQAIKNVSQLKLLDDNETAAINTLIEKVETAQASVMTGGGQSNTSDSLPSHNDGGNNKIFAYESAAGAEHKGNNDQAGTGRKVLIREYYKCCECGAIVEDKKVSTDKSYRIGSFNGVGPLKWGAVAAAVAAATTTAAASSSSWSSSSSSRRSGGSSFGSRRSSSSTFGGGRFGGGGAGGSF